MPLWIAFPVCVVIGAIGGYMSFTIDQHFNRHDRKDD